MKAVIQRVREARVDIDGRTVAEQGDDNRQTNGDFSGGNRHHEKDENLTVHLAQFARRRHESQVRGVEH